MEHMLVTSKNRSHTGGLLTFASYIRGQGGLNLAIVTSNTKNKSLTMSSEDILPTYEEAIRMYEIPTQMIRDEAMYITFKESSPSAKLNSSIFRKETDAQHDVYTGKRKKNKVAAFLGDVLTGKCLLDLSHS